MNDILNHSHSFSFALKIHIICVLPFFPSVRMLKLQTFILKKKIKINKNSITRLRCIQFDENIKRKNLS